VGQRLVVALGRGVHGLRGALRVEILTDRPEFRYAPGRVLYREGSDDPLTIDWSSAIADGPGWRIRFREVASRTAAEALIGTYLETIAGPEAEPPRGAYLWHEVIGTTVTAVDGTVLGTVQDVYRSGGAEVYTVTGGPYGEFDVPGVRAFVRVFAPRRGEIVIDAEALDLRPRRARDPDPNRPKAPRRRTRSPNAPQPQGAAADAPDSPDAADAADAEPPT
jgi:16S rRNA processing protein RimM